jgi:ABC-type thiamin/hydroxymethylpyrimidine transport system permease subunit
MSLDGTAPAGHHGLSVMELVAMEVVHAHLLGPVTITLDTIFHGTVTGDVTVLGGVHLDLLGTVLGNLMIEDSGTACVGGVVAEVVINALSNDIAG